MSDLRERLNRAFTRVPIDAPAQEYAVVALPVVAEWLRAEAAGWHSRGNYEIQMRRERAGMRLRTAGLAITGLADALTQKEPAP